MGRVRRITDLYLGSIATTKVLSITSSETLYTIGSGNRAFEAGNLSNFNIFYGQSSLAANSGLFISSGGGAKFWDSIIGNFQMYFRVASGGQTVQLIIQEYAGNG